MHKTLTLTPTCTDRAQKYYEYFMLSFQTIISSYL